MGILDNALKQIKIDIDMPKHNETPCYCSHAMYKMWAAAVARISDSIFFFKISINLKTIARKVILGTKIQLI